MDKQELEFLVLDGLRLREIAKKTNRSERVVGYWLNKYNLNVKRKKVCERCGETKLKNFDVNRYTICKYCRRTARTRDKKLEMVNYKGGKCQRCCYSVCLDSFDFHHLKKDEKDPNWVKMRKWKLEKVKLELDKCILVCKNCHAEIHFLEKYMISLTDENFNLEIIDFKGLVVVDFFSMWCRPCNMLMPVFERLAMAPQNIDIRFAKLNTMENPVVTQQFGISAIPAILFFKDGNLVRKLLGYTTEDQLQKHINELK